MGRCVLFVFFGWGDCKWARSGLADGPWMGREGRATPEGRVGKKEGGGGFSGKADRQRRRSRLVARKGFLEAQPQGLDVRVVGQLEHARGGAGRGEGVVGRVGEHNLDRL